MHSWYSWLLLQGEGVMTAVQEPHVLLLLVCSEVRPGSASSGSSSLATSMAITLRHLGRRHHHWDLQERAAGRHQLLSYMLLYGCHGH